MKRRFTPIIAITAGLILISGLAYALDKKKQTKPAEGLPDSIHEEEALRAELLAATGELQKQPGGAEPKNKKVAVVRTGAGLAGPKASK